MSASNRTRSRSAAASSWRAPARSASAAARWASAWRMSSVRAPASSRRSWASAPAALGRGAAQREVDVGGVELGDQVAGLHAVALGDGELDEPSADFRGHLDFGGFDVAGDAHVVGWRLLAASGREDGNGGERGDGRDRGGGREAAGWVVTHDGTPVGLGTTAAAGASARRLSCWRCATKRSASSRCASNRATRAMALRIGLVAR